jgi:hypothetical protein
LLLIIIDLPAKMSMSDKGNVEIIIRVRKEERMGRHLRSENFPETVEVGTMEDTIVVGSFKRNPDGSITINCQIDFTNRETGETWRCESRVLRLPRVKRARKD